MASGAMTPEERDAFLADVHVGILAIDEPGRGPLAMPIWYLYRDDEVRIHMEGSSLKARLLRAAGRATMTVQTEHAPYKYVSVEGPVELVAPTDGNLEMAVRYLGPEVGQRYADHTPLNDDSVVAVLRPEHWRTFDFGKA